ncbi:hypothetical protein ABZV91_17975 [Nocardia sp. NPDC004568]|uniref:hypothetical protein n=1 Tax=Nocardia sp. NPDC004568 TaxID=3154551 RepID=UPI0033AE1AED
MSGRASRKVTEIAQSLCKTLTTVSEAVAGGWRRRAGTAAAGAGTLRARSASAWAEVAGPEPWPAAVATPGGDPRPPPATVAAHIARTGWSTEPITLRAHTTDAGTVIPPRTLAESLATAPVDTRIFWSRAGLTELFEQNIRGGVRLDRLDLLGPINPHYNCHGYTFSRDGAAGCIAGRMVDRILSDNGFRRVDDLGTAVPGDVVIYRKDGNVQHSGVVAQVRAGEILVDSKQGPLSTVRHRLDEVTGFYGSDVSVYRTDRPDGRFLSPVDDSERLAPPWPPTPAPGQP